MDAFLEHWQLFRWSWLSAVLIAILLAQIGVVVVARDQIFLGAAISQASTLGIALALGLGGWLGGRAAALAEGDVFPAVLAVAFSMLAALATAGGGGRRGLASREAMTGWVFLGSSSLAILIVAHSPHGLEEIHKLLFSTLVAATWQDAAIFAALSSATAAIVIFARSRLLLFTLDPAMADAVGLRTRVWSFGAYAWLGLAVGLSLETSGLLYTFGCLVLPSLIAKHLVREVGPIFIVAPALGAAGAIAGLALAHAGDYPPAQMTVALLSLLLLPAWAYGRARGEG
jgi:ABC-type Mn2+/Zn2+ transport system permease subunit